MLDLELCMETKAFSFITKNAEACIHILQLFE